MEAIESNGKTISYKKQKSLDLRLGFYLTGKTSWNISLTLNKAGFYVAYVTVQENQININKLQSFC